LGKPWVVMLVSALLAGGCGTAPDRVPVSAAVTGQPAEQKDVTAVLYDQYREWRGTPYRYGGTRRDGIDCSAFVARTLRERFDTSVPRTTVEQSRSGRPVPRGAWQPGDLVFLARLIPQREARQQSTDEDRRQKDQNHVNASQPGGDHGRPRTISAQTPADTKTARTDNQPEINRPAWRTGKAVPKERFRSPAKQGIPGQADEQRAGHDIHKGRIPVAMQVQKSQDPLRIGHLRQGQAEAEYHAAGQGGEQATHG